MLRASEVAEPGSRRIVVLREYPTADRVAPDTL